MIGADKMDRKAPAILLAMLMKSRHSRAISQRTAAGSRLLDLDGHKRPLQDRWLLAPRFPLTLVLENGIMKLASRHMLIANAGLPEYADHNQSDAAYSHVAESNTDRHGRRRHHRRRPAARNEHGPNGLKLVRRDSHRHVARRKE